MVSSRQRLFFLFLGILAVVLLAAWLYMLGMSKLEGTPRDFGPEFRFHEEDLAYGCGSDDAVDHFNEQFG